MCYSLILITLIACYCYSDPPWLAPAKGMSFDTFVLWQAPEGRLLLANWVAVSLVGAAMPLLYFTRRRALYKRHAPHIDDLRKFAAVDPEQLVDLQKFKTKQPRKGPRKGPRPLPKWQTRRAGVKYWA